MAWYLVKHRGNFPFFSLHIHGPTVPLQTDFIVYVHYSLHISFHLSVLLNLWTSGINVLWFRSSN